MDFRILYKQSSVVLLFGALFFSDFAFADTRIDSHILLRRIHRAGIDQSMPDEIKSADTTLAVADDFYISGKLDLAERFYLLALQKSRIILSSIQSDIPEVSEEERNSVSLELSTPSQNNKPVEKKLEFQPSATKIDPTPPVMPNFSSMTIAKPGQDTAAPDQTQSPKETEPDPQLLFSSKIVGTAAVYTVAKGDTLGLVTAKLGVNRGQLVRLNGLSSSTASLKVGQKLRYNNRKIIPAKIKNGLVINVADKTLYYFKKGKLVISLPVALGVPVENEKYNWKTPLGKFKITAKIKDPTWTVPKSIQSEMEDRGKEVITSVPPGDDNPLGKYAMKTSLPGILIHSTIKPWSIYGYTSHGCIRVFPEKMEELFSIVSVNTPGEIIYRPVKIAETENGKILLEAHNDAYGVYKGYVELIQEVRGVIEKSRLSNRVDWKRVEAVLRQKNGVAEDVTMLQ